MPPQFLTDNNGTETRETCRKKINILAPTLDQQKLKASDRQNGLK